ncbi:PucR family transcriptional regulator [Bifidobacterium cuniculi]|uniref:Regulator of polyketide synthase expression n=1 Tax=Bifidobacterium cuniculi TaxID=1688 RepID=A0A087AY60_9BIFI|nr:PucR family transcriptional regulator [Bifidobacterium cuniculi]KFI63710.1 regulator of polyketide synthase expression [Bifidobacterium cuniculi]
MLGNEHDDFLDLLGGRTDDDTIARIAFECLLNGIDDSRVTALLNIVGWRGEFSCFAIGGEPAQSLGDTVAAMRGSIADLGGIAPLIGVYGSIIIMCARVQAAVSPEVACTAVMPAFAKDRAVYLSPIRAGLEGAMHTVRETVFSLQAAPALLNAPRPLRADDVLPERALIGDDLARDELYRNVYLVLRGDNDDDPTFRTVSTFLEHGGSLETTAKELGIHPNTVRYRLKRAAETIGWDVTDPRDAFVLNTALAIGRIRDR